MTTQKRNTHHQFNFTVMTRNKFTKIFFSAMLMTCSTLAFSQWAGSSYGIYYDAGYVGIGGQPLSTTNLLINHEGSELRVQFSPTTEGFVIGDGTANLTLATKVVNGSDLTPYNAFVHLDHSTSNVGIGHLSPGYKLEVAGNVKVNANNGDGFLLNSGTANRSGLLRQTSNDISLNANGREVMRLLDDGNVGVGLVDPTRLFQIHSSNNPTLAIGKLNTNTSGKATLQFYAATGTSGNGFKLQFNKAPGVDRLDVIDGGAREVLSIKNGGDIGIGTITPSRKLDVIGDVRASGFFQSDAYRNEATDAMLHYTNNMISLGSGNSAQLVRVYSGGLERMRVTTDGDIGIGTTDPGSYKLAVEGKIGARSIKVTSASVWADYVFAPEYNLMSLPEVESYIKKHNHLPNIPSAKEVEEEGFELEKMDALLLEKIEELTLHIIEQNKKLEAQAQKIEELQKAIK